MHVFSRSPSPSLLPVVDMHNLPLPSKNYRGDLLSAETVHIPTLIFICMGIRHKLLLRYLDGNLDTNMIGNMFGRRLAYHNRSLLVIFVYTYSYH